MMATPRLNGSSTDKTALDRTGLKTIHPELLDENGNVTEEELWAVRFEDLDGFSTAAKAWPTRGRPASAAKDCKTRD